MPKVATTSLPSVATSCTRRWFPHDYSDRSAKDLIGACWWCAAQRLGCLRRGALGHQNLWFQTRWDELFENGTVC